MKNFLFGFTYPFRSIKFFFSHPVLLKYSLIPVLINILIYGSVFIFSYIQLASILEKWTGAKQPGAGFWVEFIHTALMAVSLVVLLLVSYLLFVILGGIVTAPFNEEISQRVEEIVTHGEVKHNMGFWEDAYTSITGELKKLVFYFFFLFLIFLFNFIPVIGNIFSAVIGAVFSFFYNSLDFLDYPMTRKKMKFRQKLKITRSGKMITYGFGCAAFLLMFLPVVNVFMKPVLVAAGTGLYYEKDFCSHDLLKNG